MIEATKPAELTEMEKWRRNLPVNTAKLYQEMDDDYLDSIGAGVREGQVPATPQAAPPQVPPATP